LRCRPHADHQRARSERVPDPRIPARLGSVRYVGRRLSCMARGGTIALALIAGLAPLRLGAQEATMNRLTDAERAAGWRLLFDGTSTAGWRGYMRNDMPAGWQVVNGTLTRV